MVNSRVLVTGASGFIGRNLVNYIKSNSNSNNFFFTSRSGQSDRNFLPADLLDQNQQVKLLEDIRPDVLVHLAWIASSDDYVENRLNQIWLDASVTLINNFIQFGGSRVIITGSCAEYGTGSNIASFKEGDPTFATSEFSRCKIALHDYLQKTSMQNDIEHAWLRLFYVYGTDEPARKFFSTLIRSMMNEKEFVVNSPMSRIDFIDVLDVSFIISKIIELNYNGVLNVGTGEGLMLGKISKDIEFSLGKKNLIRFGNQPPINTIADISKLKNIVGSRNFLSVLSRIGVHKFENNKNN